MKKITIALFALAFLMCSIGCKKTAKEKAENKPVIENRSQVATGKLQEYFHSRIKLEVQESSPVTQKSSTSKSTDTQKKIKKITTNRLSDLSSLINWNESFTHSITETNLVLVPFSEEITPFKNKDYEFVRFLIFQELETGQLELSILEILGDKKKSLGNAKQVALKALGNIYATTSSSIGNLDASVILFNDQYKRLKSFHITNGDWKDKRIDFRSDLEIRN